jgi:hypothetical protein
MGIAAGVLTLLSGNHTSRDNSAWRCRFSPLVVTD